MRTAAALVLVLLCAFGIVLLWRRANGREARRVRREDEAAARRTIEDLARLRRF